MIGIIDYGAGNTGNVRRALNRLGRENTICETTTAAEQCDLLILPGVGAFPPAMEKLNTSGWNSFLQEWVAAGNPILGICLGMQLLCETSLEDSPTPGLGFIKGTVRLLEGTMRLPHMGWNQVMWQDVPGTLRDICPDGSNLYFVHSYALMDSPDAAAITTVDDVSFVSVVRRGKVLGCQFHPERSGPLGLKLLEGILDHLEGIR